MKICIPVESDEGLTAKVFGHFGSAPYFLIYDSENDGFEVIGNEDSEHVHGNCHPLKVLEGKQIDIGIRGDFFVPDSKGYAGISGYSLSPLAVTEKNPYLWQVGPYLTWWQSPFVKFRVEYDHSEGDGISYPEDVLWFQCIFGTEPHKHERH